MTQYVHHRWRRLRLIRHLRHLWLPLILKWYLLLHPWHTCLWLMWYLLLLRRLWLCLRLLWHLCRLLLLCNMSCLSLLFRQPRT